MTEVLFLSIKALNYDISLYDLELGGKFSFQGTVKIEAEITSPTNRITLNSIDLMIHGAEISGDGITREIQFMQWSSVDCMADIHAAQMASDISYHAESQRVTFTFQEELIQSKAAVLQIKYSGIMNNTMAGFYRSGYKPAVTPAPSVPKEGGYHYMFSTQFESSDARRAFPCFDEPNLKATFDFSIEIPEDQVALSNMPERGVHQGKNGRKVVSFHRTPLMSTYVGSNIIRLPPPNIEYPAAGIFHHNPSLDPFSSFSSNVTCSALMS